MSTPTYTKHTQHHPRKTHSPHKHPAHAHPRKNTHPRYTLPTHPAHKGTVVQGGEGGLERGPIPLSGLFLGSQDCPQRPRTTPKSCVLPLSGFLHLVRCFFVFFFCIFCFSYVSDPSSSASSSAFSSASFSPCCHLGSVVADHARSWVPTSAGFFCGLITMDNPRWWV